MKWTVLLLSLCACEPTRPRSSGGCGESVWTFEAPSTVSFGSEQRDAVSATLEPVP
jgi:hypothetical protein